MTRPDLIFAIPTYRLRDVGETVEEYDRHFWRNGHSVRIMVFDDSSAANQEKYFRIVSYLTEELVRLGHDVTLFASGDSETSARLVPGCSRALWRDPDVRETLPHHVRLMELVFRDAALFDVIHFHSDCVHFPLVRRHRVPSVTTLHGMVHTHDLGALLEEYRDVPLVSISDEQRRPMPQANWRATVYHGLPRDAFTFRKDAGRYLTYLGRMSPEKRVDRAIEIARRAGMPLKIAAKIYPEERAHFDETLAPLMAAAGPLVEFVGEIDDRGRDDLLGGAAALLFPSSGPSRSAS